MVFIFKFICIYVYCKASLNWYLYPRYANNNTIEVNNVSISNSRQFILINKQFLIKMSLPPTFVKGFHDENVIKRMKYVKFGATDLVVSQLSLGTGGFSTLYGVFSLEECRATVVDALKQGINYIDTAPYYGTGESETTLGQCLKGIPRQAYYVSTKVGRYETDPKRMFDFSAKRTRESIEMSLKKLGIDYIDVINVHDIEFAPSLDIVLNETLPTLVEAVKQGKARYIGVTGYPVSTLAECIERSKIKIDAVLSYSRLCLLDTALNDFLPVFQSKNLGIVNAAPACMGLLSSRGPQPWNIAQQYIKDACKTASEYCKEHGNIELCRLALYFSLNQPGPHTHLIGMNTRQLLKENLDVLFNGITDNEKEVLEYLQKNVFSKLKQGHWEGIEVANYRKAIST
ncbi:L-galactose dehydrogenase-like [Agrilus planipennis]|uniref:L-galactose dehydrogenase-like n=1 Tax=Agrilus planipennis TaxID=224129 RepID=A0A7F5R2X5_AGRPL|nr:L-galactose dehydrogenase-like [Agrilus planipennis]